MHSAKSNERLVMANHPCFSEDGPQGRRPHPPAGRARLQHPVRLLRAQVRLRQRVADPAWRASILTPAGGASSASRRSSSATRRHRRGRHRRPGRPARQRGDLRDARPRPPLLPRARSAASPPTGSRCRTGSTTWSPPASASITVTINAVMPETADEVYAWVTGPDGEQLRGIEARPLPARAPVGRPAHGGRGRARRQGELGAHPRRQRPRAPDDRACSPPSTARTSTTSCRSSRRTSSAAHDAARRPPQIHAARAACGEYLSQMTHCKQCRADACGIIGKDRDMETETLMARLGDVYEDSIF